MAGLLERYVEQAIPNHFVPSFVSFALRLGAAPEALFARVGRSLAEAREPGASFGVRELERLFEALSDTVQRPDLALHVGREVDPERLGLFGLVLSTSSTPRATFAAMSEFKALFHPLLDLSVHEQAGRTHLRYAARDGGPIGAKPYYAEALFSTLHAAASIYYGSDTPPLHASFRHRAPPHAESYTRVFRCEIRFEQPVDELCYGHAFLDTPWHGASASNHALRERALRELSLESRVERVLHERLREELDVEAVARALAMSSRHLQRSLRTAGTSYRALRDRVRHRRACALLEQGLATASVAEALGYGDRSNFVRAFERWAGECPSAYRSRVRLARNDTRGASTHTVESTG
ncbi:MAG: AraC family transcriptional regulator ligand-binding domain-containing protein [Polyangiales bacterium]